MLAPLSTYSLFELKSEMLRILDQERQGLPISERYKKTLHTYMKLAKGGGE